MTLLQGNVIQNEDLRLPIPTPLSLAHLAMWHLIGEQAFDVIEEQSLRITFSVQLNKRQRVIFDMVETALINKAPLNIFVVERGGTGETFLYKAICSLVQSLGKIVIPIAWSGIAAILMPGGQACYARF
jgi:type IV secretory pathway ATPase VirB11/archaellum biosynthesis ATPase